MESMIVQQFLDGWINQVILCPSTGDDAEVHQVTCHKDRQQNKNALQENGRVLVGELTATARPPQDCIQADGRGNPPIRLERCPSMEEASARACKRKDDRHDYK